VVEGPFSVFRLHARATVALMGTSLSPHQVALLQEHGVAQLTFLLDGDDAGRAAVPAMMALLATTTLRAKFAVLPECTQPDTVDLATLVEVLGLPSRSLI
jgi:DNA primase